MYGQLVADELRLGCAVSCTVQRGAQDLSRCSTCLHLYQTHPIMSLHFSFKTASSPAYSARCLKVPIRETTMTKTPRNRNRVQREHKLLLTRDATYCHWRSVSAFEFSCAFLIATLQCSYQDWRCGGLAFQVSSSHIGSNSQGRSRYSMTTVSSTERRRLHSRPAVRCDGSRRSSAPMTSNEFCTSIFLISSHANF